MTKRAFGASYKQALELMKAGCPLDFVSTLKREVFRAEQLDGYAESCVYASGPLDTHYVIALRLGTDRASGSIIADWSFEPPWADHAICWDYEARDLIPERDLDAYKNLLSSRLMGVLNEHRLLQPGYPVDGLLCGCSYQPMPQSGDHFVSARLTLVDVLGNQVELDIRLAVVRPAGSHRKASHADRPAVTMQRLRR